MNINNVVVLKFEMSQEWEVLSEVCLPADPPLNPAHTTLSWRGDAKYLAANVLLEDGVSRRLYMYDRDQGQPEGRALPLPGLLPEMAWQPNSRHLFTGTHLNGGSRWVKLPLEVWQTCFLASSLSTCSLVASF